MEILLMISRVRFKFVFFLKCWPLTAHILTMMDAISVKKICPPKTRQMIFLSKEPQELQYLRKQGSKLVGH